MLLKFPMMLIEHNTFKIWLAVQHPGKSTASSLADIGNQWEGNFEISNILYCYARRVGREERENEISSGGWRFIITR